MTGFRKCGIFPLDPNAIDVTRLLPTQRRPPTTAANMPGGIPHPAAAVLPVTAATEDPASSTTSSPVGTSANAPHPVLDHPLVVAGLVQPDLAEVLTRVQTRRTSFRSITADARVVTGEEYERLLQEREDRARVAAEQRATRARGAEGRPCQGGGGAESRPCQSGGRA